MYFERSIFSPYISGDWNFHYNCDINFKYILFSSFTSFSTSVEAVVKRCFMKKVFLKIVCQSLFLNKAEGLRLFLTENFWWLLLYLFGKLALYEILRIGQFSLTRQVQMLWLSLGHSKFLLMGEIIEEMFIWL